MEKISDLSWYTNNRACIEKLIISLPTYTKKIGANEFWLKDKSFNNDWEFDVIIFLNFNETRIEISASSSAFSLDVKYIHDYISSRIKAAIIDEDGEECKFKQFFIFI